MGRRARGKAKVAGAGGTNCTVAFARSMFIFYYYSIRGHFRRGAHVACGGLSWPILSANLAPCDNDIVRFLISFINSSFFLAIFIYKFIFYYD